MPKLWKDNDLCPDCGQKWPEPNLEQCVLSKPLYISIPAGKHIHIDCPVHGEHILYGSSIRM